MVTHPERAPARTIASNPMRDPHTLDLRRSRGVVPTLRTEYGHEHHHHQRRRFLFTTLVHEHFHAALATGVDRDGHAPAAARPRRWSSRNSLE